ERTPPVAPLLGSARRRFGVEGNAVESVVVGDEREPAREPLVEITRKGLARVRGELPVTDLPLDAATGLLLEVDDDGLAPPPGGNALALDGTSDLGVVELISTDAFEEREPVGPRASGALLDRFGSHG